MTGGGAIWSIVAATAAGTALQTGEAAALDQSLADSSSDGPYRPAQWQNAPLVTMTVPGTSSTFSDTGSSAAINSSGGVPITGGTFSVGTVEQTTQGTPDQVYVFDAVIRTEHQQRIEATQQPIQTGANIRDHAFIMPARVVLEIGMSDAMDSFTPGQWTGDSAKSVNTYQTLLGIAKARGTPNPLTITTRLNVYTNMLLTDISAPDTAETRFGLKATVVFEELLTGTVASQQVSARSDLTGATNLGTKSPLPVPNSILQQNETAQPTTVPNAGVLSSNPIDGS
jgi:hypothetical protein